MLACAALAASLMVRLQRESSATWRAKLLLLCAIIASMGMARPPYSALAVLPLALTRLPARVRWLSASTTFVVTAGWSASCAVWTLVSVDPFHKADPARQVYYLAAHIFTLPSLVFDTLSRYFLTEYAGYFVAPLQLHPAYFVTAWFVLASALAGSAVAGARPQVRTALVVGVAILVAIFGIFALQYLTWTAVGASTIDGVLGRYFLPLAVLFGCCLTRPEGATVGPNWFYPIVVAFPVISIVLSLHSLILRFYI